MADHCPGCGHRFIKDYTVPIRDGFCHWCVAEQDAPVKTRSCHVCQKNAACTGLIGLLCESPNCIEIDDLMWKIDYIKRTRED